MYREIAGPPASRPAADLAQAAVVETCGVTFAGIDSRLSGRFAQVSESEFCDGPTAQPRCFFGPEDSDDRIEVGWTAGGGGEWAVTDRVSLGLEYLFVSLGDDKRRITFFGDIVAAEPNAPPSFDIVDKVDFDLHVVRAKLNVKF